MFHPRYDARAKTYRYNILRAEICSPFEWRYVHHYPYPLDEEAMRRLASAFAGEHDFTAYAAADESDAERKSKVRTIFESVLERVRGTADLPSPWKWIPKAYGEESGGDAH